MASLNDALIIGRSGVLTHQERLNVISHNIANVDTPGYHRQRAVLAVNPPQRPNLYQTRNYDIGTGVRVDDVVRDFNNLLESTLLKETSIYEKNALLADALGNLEGLMNAGPEDALSTAMRQFWSAWQDLANNADDVAFRQVVIERAITLVGQINYTADRLQEYRAGIAAGGVGPDFTGVIPRQVDEVNSLASRIADLNKRITTSEGQGINCNDLCDTRDQLLLKLSALVNTTKATDGTITIDGQVLISADGQTVNELMIMDADSNPIQLSLDGAAVNITGGQIGGWVEAASFCEYYSGQLDILAGALISEVNALHISGYDLDGNDGLEFFTGTTAADMAINTLIHDPANPAMDNPRLIAAANTLHDMGPPRIPNVGDGANALEIADLCYADLAALGDMTFNEFYAAMVGDLGAAVQTAETLAGDGAQVISMLEDAIQSESGVNLDEELIEMLQAQRAYQAAARIISTVDEMLQVVLSM
ncbi:MAG: flagellar hook-associated protein FlgK [Spartobacteria bacterium]|nr:flagellar hook-associated protein FlgK [Spartobacteria bacterium]